MSRFLTWYRQQHIFVKCILIFSSTTLLVGVIFLFNLIFINVVANNAMHPILQSDEVLEKSIDEIPRPNYLPLIYFDVLKTQREIMRDRKSHHLGLAILFFRNYYSILFLSIILASVGGLTLFAIANKGWSNAGITLQTFFLTLATELAFVGFFPLVFKQQDNFTQNMTYYENYSKGELTIYNQLSSLQNPFKSKKDSSGILRITGDSIFFYHRLDSLVKYNNDYLSNLTTYVLTIDPDQAKNITINNVYSALQKSRVIADSTK